MAPNSKPDEPSRTWYGSSTRAVTGAFGALGRVVSSVGQSIPGRDRLKNIGRFGSGQVSDLPRPDHHDPPKFDPLKGRQRPSQSKDEHISSSCQPPQYKIIAPPLTVGEEPSCTWYGSSTRVVAGTFGALGTVLSLVGENITGRGRSKNIGHVLPQPDHPDPTEIDFLKEAQCPSQSKDEHTGLSVAGEEPSRTLYGFSTRAVAGEFGDLDTVLSSVGENIPERDGWKNIEQFGFDKVSDLPQPDHHDPPKIDFLKETQSPSQSEDEHTGLSVTGEEPSRTLYGSSMRAVAGESGSLGTVLSSVGENIPGRDGWKDIEQFGSDKFSDLPRPDHPGPTEIDFLKEAQCPSQSKDEHTGLFVAGEEPSRTLYGSSTRAVAGEFGALDTVLSLVGENIPERDGWKNIEQFGFDKVFDLPQPDHHDPPKIDFLKETQSPSQSEDEHRGLSVAGEEPSCTLYGSSMRAVAGESGSLGTVLSSVGENIPGRDGWKDIEQFGSDKFSDLPRPDHPDPREIDFLKETQNPSQLNVEHRGLSVAAGEEPSLTWYGSSMRAVAGAFKALGTVLSSVGKYIPGRDRWKNIGRFGPDKVSNLPRPDHHDSPKIVFLKETQSPSQSKDEHQGGASNAENARQGWYSLSCGLVASAGQYLYSLGINSARSMVSTWRTMYKSGQVIFWRVINAVRADMTNPKGWVRSGLRVTDAVAPELLGRRYGAYRLTKKVVNAALKELKDREWMVKENDQDIQIKSTNTSINSSQNHGSMGEERQGSADREGLQAPENCSGDAAGGTKEQTSSADLANDNGLVGRNVKENDKDIRIESTNTSINSGQNHGSMGEERQGSADGEVLQAPEHCSGDAAGATKEQTSSDLGK